MKIRFRMEREDKRKFIGLVIPIALFATTSFAFQIFSKQFGTKGGYFLGFAFYWIFWCMLVPLFFLSKQEISGLFRPNFSLFKDKLFYNLLFLTVPLLFVYIYAFPKALESANFQIFLFSLALGLINALTEELLWRGLYLKLFSDDKWLYILISSLGFAIWHLAPLQIFPNKEPGGQISFVVFAFFLGILFSTVVYNTKSILLVSIAHMLLNFAGLGARVYLN